MTKLSDAASFFTHTNLMNFSNECTGLNKQRMLNGDSRCALPVNGLHSTNPKSALNHSNIVILFLF